MNQKDIGQTFVEFPYHAGSVAQKCIVLRKSQYFISLG